MIKDEEEDSKAEKIFKSIDEVMATVKHVCESLQNETIYKLHESMPDSFRKIIKMKGHRKKSKLFIDTKYIILY